MVILLLVSNLTHVFEIESVRATGSVGLWVSKKDMPTARSNLAAVSVGEKIYAIGGFVYEGGQYYPTALIEVYDTVTDTWNSGKPLPIASGLIGAVAIENKIYTLLGETGRFFCYDVASDEWSELCSFPADANTASFGMAAIGNKIYVVRGSGSYPAGTYWTYCYDVLTDTWIEKSPLPYHRTVESLAVLNNKLYAIGGSDPSLGARIEVDRIDVYDPFTDTWQLDAIPRMSVPRTHLEPETPVVNGKIYVIGGWDGYSELNIVEEYDPVKNAWNTLTPMPTARYALATAIVNGKIYCIGGDSGGYGGHPKTANEELSLAYPIYIRADGSIDPGDAPIITHDNTTYILTDDITTYASGVIVEKSNVIIDGANHTIKGVGEFAQIGVEINEVVNVTVQNLNLQNFATGIWICNSLKNTIYNNTITCHQFGVKIDNSSNNNILKNYFFGCGLFIQDSHSNIVTDNLVNGKPLVYLEEVTDYTVKDAGQIILLKCNNIKVENLNLLNASVGILLLQTNNSLIINNNVTGNNFAGIHLRFSSNNSISNNYIANNEIAVSLDNFSNNNSIFGNDLKDNPSYGIRLIQSFCNIVLNNVISTEVLSSLDLVPAAIYLTSANNNTISGNNISNYYLNGIVIGSYNEFYEDFYYNDDSQSSNNLITNNTITLINSLLEAYSNGITIYGLSNNNTLKFNKISGSYYGVYIEDSFNNLIAQNEIEKTSIGIGIFGYGSSGNGIIENQVFDNRWGIVYFCTEKNTMYKNNIRNNDIGIEFWGYATEIIIFENIILNNTYGISFGGEGGGENNIIYHNSFVNNTYQVDEGSLWQYNFWDIGYPSGGNYWSDYDGVDEKSGSGQDQPGSDGIGDTPYFICENNVDRYPFIRPEFPSIPVGKPFVILSSSSNIVKEDVENVIFTAIAYDFDGYIESYLFDYGDGHDSGWVSDSSISWTYFSPGEYKAKVKVRDNDGIESEWSYPVDIIVSSINKPTAILSAFPTTVKEDVESVTFDASASYDPDGNVASYLFNFGDGSDSGWISDSKISKVYSNPGSYLAKVKVRDNDGIESDWSNTVMITVTALPPPPPENQKPIARLSASPTTVEEDYQSVTLDASASNDPDGSVVAYWFDYGDGTNSGWITSSKISKIYNNVGEYFVKVKVRDDKGSESDWSDAIKVKVILSPDPFIPENGIVVSPGTPKMGEWYTITIKVFNPSAVKKSVSIFLKETGIKTGFGDVIYPVLTQGPYEIGSNQNQLFKFTLIHRWDWLHPFIELPWWIEFVTSRFLKEAVKEGFNVNLPGFVYSLLIKSLTLAGSTPEAIYSYSIASNIPTIQKEIQVKVEVPQSKKDHIFTSASLTIIGSVLTEMGVWLMNPLTWSFAVALVISQGISMAASALEWNFARDPPDFNYTYIVSARSITLPQLDEINDTRSKELVERFLSLYANMEAAKVSFERYQGASIMNNTEWMLKQLEAAHVYMSMATKDLIEVKKELNPLIMDIQSTGFTLNLTVIQEIRNNLTHGLPPLEVEILRAFNFTDDEINAIKQGLIEIPDQILLNYTDTLKMLDCLIPTFVNMTTTYMEMQNEIRATVLNETRTLTYLVYVNEQLLSVGIDSNSTITSFYFSQDQKMIRFYAEGFNGTLGFCNVTIPKELLKGEPWAVMLNGTSWSYTLTENETYSFIYFTYNYSSTYEVTIQGTWVIPEFHSTIIFALFILTTLFATAVLKTKRKRQHT
jgi:parallel beta-helix repeat protein